MQRLHVVELCAGAGGQALGLDQAGFDHRLAIELDKQAAATLQLNRPSWDVRTGNVTDSRLWNPSDYSNIDLLAGGVPCPPFSVAGKQLGATDDRDLFAWAVDLAITIQAKALLLENVRGLASARFSGYREYISSKLEAAGYWSEWKLMSAHQHGVPQIRTRFILVAIQEQMAGNFAWPATSRTDRTVGKELFPLMSQRGWPGSGSWVGKARGLAPTLVGGSRKHGGADLGPTGAKKAWARLAIDGHGVADAAPGPECGLDHIPRLTCEMAAVLQGWNTGRSPEWLFSGRKTAVYRQIGNAFPPPMAEALGKSIKTALTNRKSKPPVEEPTRSVDALYRELSTCQQPRTLAQLQSITRTNSEKVLLRALNNLKRDFFIEEHDLDGTVAYKFVKFRGGMARPR